MHFDFVQKSKLPIISRSFLKTQNTIRQEIKVPSKYDKRECENVANWDLLCESIFLRGNNSDPYIRIRERIDNVFISKMDDILNSY